MQDVEARHAGQPDVQDDQIEGLVLEDAVGAETVVLQVHGMAETAQPADDGVGQILVVFDYQDAHGPDCSAVGFTPSSAPASPAGGSATHNND
ncbi:hypothetical protein G6F57_020072 [Rhizopus arrhizus]|nr:hypothetical protein G6F57_020072 [Rhizopus arrhizus]